MITKEQLHSHGFAKHKIGSWTVWSRDKECGDQFLELCCQEPKDEKSGFIPVSCGKDSDVYRFEFNNRTFYFKEFLCRGLGDKIKGIFRDSRAVRALRGEFIITDAGLNTPPILVIGENGIRNFMVTEEVPNATSLHFMVIAPEKYPIPPHRFATIIGETVGTLHANGISHGDLRRGNILWNVKNNVVKFYFIDNERTLRYHRLPRRLRFKNLVQLAMGAGKLSTYLILRFWITYLKENPDLRAHSRHWFKSVQAKAEQRQKKAASGQNSRSIS